MVMGRLRWLVVTVVVALACAFVVGRGQDINWDLQSYHYFAGYSYLQGRFSEDVMPTYLQTYLDPIPNVLAYAAYSKLRFPFSSLLLLALQLTALPALFLVAREVGKSLGNREVTASEIAAVAVGLVSPVWWSELGTSFYSSTTAPLVLLAVWLLLRGSAHEPVAKNLGLHFSSSGALLGLAMSFKLTNALFIGAGALALAPLFRRWPPRSVLLGIAAYAGGVLIGFAINAHWYIAVFREFGNPIFPFYNGIFRSEYFDAVNFHDDRFAFRDLSTLIRFIGVSALGTSATAEVAFADARLAICGALALLALGLRFARQGEWNRRYGPGAAVTLVFVSASFATWAFMFAYQRYLIPIELLLGLVMWILLDSIVAIERRASYGLALCFIVAIALVRIPDWGHLGAERAQRSNPFGLEVPDALTRAPAEYLLVGVPIGYVLPFLHKESHFYRIDFSPRVFDRIRDRLGHFRDRPVRLLAVTPWPLSAIDVSRNFGYEPVGPCVTFASQLGSYMTCEMMPRRP